MECTVIDVYFVPFKPCPALTPPQCKPPTMVSNNIQSNQQPRPDPPPNPFPASHLVEDGVVGRDARGVRGDCLDHVAVAVHQDQDQIEVDAGGPRPRVLQRSVHRPAWVKIAKAPFN